ncbi:hypothetical protein KXD40_002415 [Peronospora effusa]|uniref:Uncharacterized protein n=1 Tax=Peronospora effusa TaxID=542832 RepID=A0A3M6VID1_9STRA|nr:hypothetical protein DD238_004532 [Peronospora effusa]UIZ26465.1 hypothetical protein KXD40_002415 [Peronospora effusa]CAI5704039.1 unnamed protein product [Peronospora effusa]
MDRRYTDTPAKQSSIEFPTSSSGTSPKTKAAGTTDEKQDLKESKKGDRVSDEHCLSTTGNHDDRVDNIHDVAYGSNHHQVHNRRPLQQDACASSSSMTMQGSSAPVQSIATSDRVTTSFPHGGQTSALTPTKSTGANGNLHTNSPVVNPVVNPMMEKKRQAQRESHRAYLKSNSDYNRAEIKYVSIEAELRLAEFWLEIMTKNLEDVGKRIEVHDWNFQKITGQDESNVA